MTEKKVDLKINKEDEKNLEFITRDEFYSILATQDDLKRIFDLQAVDDPSEITQDKIDEANKGMHKLATVSQIFQIAGMLNETTKDFMMKNMLGLSDTIEIQKIILKKLGASEDVAREAVEEFNARKKAHLEELKKAQEEAKKESEKKEQPKMKAVNTKAPHTRKPRGSKKNKR